MNTAFRYSSRLASKISTSRYTESDSLATIRRDIVRAQKEGIFGLVPVDNRTGGIVFPR
jgi:hypothetical protein